MDERPEAMTAADLPLPIPVAPFEMKPVLVEMWCRRGSTDLCIPAGHLAISQLSGKYYETP